jgi:hypothetical protein
MCCCEEDRVSRIGQVVHVRGGGGEGQWYVDGNTNCGGVAGTISFTAIPGDVWMLFGNLGSYTGDLADNVALHTGTSLIVIGPTGGAVSFTAVVEFRLVMHLTTAHAGD